MSESSTTPLEASRKLCMTLSQRLARMPLADIAQAIGKSDTTACRVRDGEQGLNYMEWCALLHAAGYRLVAADAVTVDESIYRGVCAITAKAMANPNIAQMILAEGE